MGRRRTLLDTPDQDDGAHPDPQVDTSMVCDWTGPLGDYERGQHVCDFDIVSCKQCDESVLRKYIYIQCELCSERYIHCKGHACPGVRCGGCRVMQETKRNIFSLFF